MRLTRARDGALLAQVELADDFLGRLRGLMFRASLPVQGGLWLEPCNSIHMLFMRFPIDAVFARRLADAPAEGGELLEVLAIRAGVRPWLGMAFCSNADLTIELPAGRAGEVGLAVGDRLEARPTEEALAA